MPSEGLYGSYSLSVAYYPDRGMPSQPRGMASELPFGSSEKEGTSRRIHKERHEVPILPPFTLDGPARRSHLLHEDRKEFRLRGLTQWRLPVKIWPLQASSSREPDAGR
jgi:hypothetical protein